MNDLELARGNLGGHTLCLCRDGEWFTDDRHGIRPLMALIAEGRDLTGYSAADQVVGKAAALLFVKCGIAAVHAVVLSESGRAVLEEAHIPFTYDTCVDRILNQAGTDTCPMEQTVASIQDPEAGYTALKERIRQMQG